MFENQRISNNPSVDNVIFLKNIIQFFDKPLSFSSHKDRRKLEIQILIELDWLCRGALPLIL